MSGIVWAIAGVVGVLVAIWIQLCHIETVLTIIAKNNGDNWEWKDEQPDILKDKQDEKITMPSYPVYPTTPQNPDQFNYPYVTWTGGEVTVTNTETKCETPVLDRMVGKVRDERAG